MDSVVRLNERGPRRENPAPIYITNKRTLLQQDHHLRPGRMDPLFGTPPDTQVPLQTNDYDCGIFVCLYAAFLDILLPLSFSQHDTWNVRTWMAHEMIEEGKLLKMIYSVLHNSLPATAAGNSATSPGNSTTIGRTATETIGTRPTQCTQPGAKTTGDRKLPKRQSESQLQRDLNRQKTYEFEIEIRKPPNSPVTTYQTNLDHE